MTKKLITINSQISDILTKLEDFSDEISINILNNDQKLEFLDLNNKLFELNIQKIKEQLEIDKQTINTLNKVFAPNLDGEEVVYENNSFLDNKIFNNTGRRVFKKKSIKEQIYNCLKENGPQTTFQLAQNLGLKNQQILNSIKSDRYFFKNINKDKTNKNGSGELSIYDIVG